MTQAQAAMEFRKQGVAAFFKLARTLDKGVLEGRDFSNVCALLWDALEGAGGEEMSAHFGSQMESFIRETGISRLHMGVDEKEGIVVTPSGVKRYELPRKMINRSEPKPQGTA